MKNAERVKTLWNEEVLLKRPAWVYSGKLKLPSRTKILFVDSVDQDKTAQNIRSCFLSTMSKKGIPPALKKKSWK